MSTIGAVGGASSAWPDPSSSRASAMKDRLFEKVDSDGNGTVDKTELQGMLDHIAEKTGGTAASADDAFSKMDTNGDGTLSKDELAAGMKSLLPAPSSTVDFAQQREGAHQDGVHHGGGHHGHHGPPPTDDTTSTSDSTATSASDLKDMMSQLMAAADTNGDQTISKSEAQTLKTNFDTAFDSAISAMPSSSASGTASSGGSSSSDPSSSGQQAGFNLSSLVDMVLKQYAAASTSQSGVGAALSVAA